MVSFAVIGGMKNQLVAVRDTCRDTGVLFGQCSGSDRSVARICPALQLASSWRIGTRAPQTMINGRLEGEQGGMRCRLVGDVAR